MIAVNEGTRRQGWATFTVLGTMLNTLGIALASTEAWYAYALMGAGILLLLRGVLLATSRPAGGDQPPRRARRGA